MDLNDARLYFEDPEDFENEYEDLFFEAKQFFYTRSVIPSVFEARLDKLKKQYEAYCFLSEEKESSCSKVGELSSVKFEGSIRGIVSKFNQERSILKQKIVSASNFEDLECSVIHYLDLYSAYASSWPLDHDGGDVKIGLETESMLLLKGVDEAEKVGVTTFDQLETLSVDHPLRMEAKRLTLWRNKFEDGI
jgi:uncharacterized protein YkvS